MALLTEAELEKISAHIVEAEKSTSAELVAVLAKTSGDYRIFSLLWPALFALAIPAVLMLLHHTDLEFGWFIQLSIFVIAALILQYPPLLRLCIPKIMQQHYCRRHARAQFLQQNLHRTRGGTGILIFVSEFEHYVEIIADHGIHQHVAENTWQTFIDAFVAHVTAGETLKGFVICIDGCGKLLAEHAPAVEGDNPNELKDRLVLV